MIRIEGQGRPPQDPKLKTPPIGSEPARAAAERAVSAAELASLRKEIAALTARVGSLEAKDIADLFAALAKRIEALEGAATKASHQTAVCDTLGRKPSTRETKARETRQSQSQSHGESRATKPWVAAGVSKATWIRRQKTPANKMKTID